MIKQYEPLFDYEDINKQISEYLKEKNWITEYKKTIQLEEEISNFLGVKHCIIVNNGTISLSLALLALGIKPGDKVAIPDLTMIATANAVKFIGAEPIFVDIDTILCMNVYKLWENLWKDHDIKAVIYVSLNGRYNEKINEITNIPIIEDNAQSFGSNNFQGKIGNTNFISSFSFSMPKIITTGQGGCLTTNNDELANKIRKLKDFGRIKGGIDIHDEFGINAKFTDLQAIVGLSQFKTINERIERKKMIYKLYYDELKDITEIEFIPTDLELTTPWFVDIYTDNCMELYKFLYDNEIGTRLVYPPIHSQKCYLEYNNLSFPVTEHYSRRGLWLPSSLTLTEEEVIYICNKIKKFYERRLE